MKAEQPAVEFLHPGGGGDIGPVAESALGEGHQGVSGELGAPPEIQTADYVELPAGYGHGSSTLAHWITANLNQDKAAPADKPAPAKLRCTKIILRRRNRANCRTSSWRWRATSW